MSVLQEQSQWLRGREFAAFLESKNVTDIELPNRQTDRISHWRKGRAVSIWKADAVLTQLGYNFSMLPDSVWYPVDWEPSHGYRNDA